MGKETSQPRIAAVAEEAVTALQRGPDQQSINLLGAFHKIEMPELSH